MERFSTPLVLSVDPDTAQKLKETKKNVIGSSYFSLFFFILSSLTISKNGEK